MFHFCICTLYVPCNHTESVCWTRYSILSINFVHLTVVSGLYAADYSFIELMPVFQTGNQSFLERHGITREFHPAASVFDIVSLSLSQNHFGLVWISERPNIQEQCSTLYHVLELQINHTLKHATWNYIAFGLCDKFVPAFQLPLCVSCERSEMKRGRIAMSENTDAKTLEIKWKRVDKIRNMKIT